MFLRSTIYLLIGLALLLITGSLDPNQTTHVRAGIIHHKTMVDPASDEYAPPAGPEGVAADRYLSPRPVPPLVGHTYITYEPLMPHEMLYHHHRVYKTQHPDAGRTRTSVRWR